MGNYTCKPVGRATLYTCQDPIILQLCPPVVGRMSLAHNYPWWIFISWWTRNWPKRCTCFRGSTSWHLDWQHLFVGPWQTNLGCVGMISGIEGDQHAIASPLQAWGGEKNWSLEPAPYRHPSVTAGWATVICSTTLTILWSHCFCFYKKYLEDFICKLFLLLV